MEQLILAKLQFKYSRIDFWNHYGDDSPQVRNIRLFNQIWIVCLSCALSLASSVCGLDSYSNAYSGFKLVKSIESIVSGCSVRIRRPVAMRLIVTTFVGVVFGIFLGVSFPPVSFSKAY